MIQLPHKLSELAQIAVDDVTHVESLPEYRIYMAQWHRPRAEDGEKPVCLLCAAGAVMTCRLNVPDGEDVVAAPGFAERFGIHNANALLAIDDLRSGDVGAAIATLAGGYESWREGISDHDLDRVIADYNEDGRIEWRLGMNQLIADLKAAGL